MYSHRNEFPQEFGQYVENDSSKIFSCISASANTGPACIHSKINSPRNFSCMYWFCAGGQGAAEMEVYTTTTERKYFGELFWPQRKTFQAGGRYKNPIKPGRTDLPPKSFLCGPHFFGNKKFLIGALRCMLSFFPMLQCNGLGQMVYFGGRGQ